MDTMTIALAGNPNAGKTSLFNALTGFRQHVGNWPGKTVEKKSGQVRVNGRTLELIDLPGTYNLTPFSPEEVITRSYLLAERPDAVICVLDAANLERNLYLTVQILEMGQPVIIALNMMDAAQARGLQIDTQMLSARLGVPVIPTVASRAQGTDGLLQAVNRVAMGQAFALDYGRDLETEITRLCQIMAQYPAIGQLYPARWLALKLLEQDQELQTALLTVPGGPALLTYAQLSIHQLSQMAGDDMDVLIANRRYTWIHALVQEVVTPTRPHNVSLSDRLDRLVLHRRWGIPIFLALMWVVFKITAESSAPLVDWIDGVINGPVARWGLAGLTAVNLQETWLASLFVDGLIAGVGGVLVFIPVLVFLYLALAALEDSGYMARAAFVMDRWMSRLGLHGKSFLPMLVGFGCSVPAIYATRTLENEKDRILTGLLVPFMSCGARLPVYALFAAIFFPQQAGLVIFGLYLLGIVTAVLLGILLKHTLFQGQEQSGLVMELPPYRLPSLRGLWFHTWVQVRAFLHHAATLILLASLVIWFLKAIPAQGNGEFADTAVPDSLFATVSQTLTPALELLGFGSWQASGALLTGLVAKEVVITTLAQTYAIPDDTTAEATPTFLEDVLWIGQSFVQAIIDTLKTLPGTLGINLFGEESEPEPTGLMAAIQQEFTQTSGGHAAAGLAFMVFILIYTPCIVTISAEKQELGTRWMWFSIGGQLLLAWLLAWLVFQVGRFLLA
ncbi:MAG: ferrous iron transport protein B [Chloroflexi bacterium]|nr:ferrous iron transport protein B [Ardenticatenaceae bacterium]NOG37137.1 ferrous iron transport protein B [Chloroflexota bacterium]